MSEQDNHFEFAKSTNEQAINNANVVLRTLLLINGGAAIALLAFIGSVIGSTTSPLAGSAAKLTMPLVWFGWGVASTVVAMAFAYFTNYVTVGHSFALYDGDTTRANRIEKWKTGFHAIAIALTCASLGLFLFGMYEVRAAILAVSP